MIKTNLLRMIKIVIRKHNGGKYGFYVRSVKKENSDGIYYKHPVGFYLYKEGEIKQHFNDMFEIDGCIDSLIRLKKINDIL